MTTFTPTLRWAALVPRPRLHRFHQPVRPGRLRRAPRVLGNPRRSRHSPDPLVRPDRHADPGMAMGLDRRGRLHGARSAVPVVELHLPAQCADRGRDDCRASVSAGGFCTWLAGGEGNLSPARGNEPRWRRAHGVPRPPPEIDISTFSSIFYWITANSLAESRGPLLNFFSMIP
jgi:hypothetical protein